jgi:hypothetical protein
MSRYVTCISSILNLLMREKRWSWLASWILFSSRRQGLIAAVRLGYVVGDREHGVLASPEDAVFLHLLLRRLGRRDLRESSRLASEIARFMRKPTSLTCTAVQYRRRIASCS